MAARVSERATCLVAKGASFEAIVGEVVVVVARCEIRIVDVQADVHILRSWTLLRASANRACAVVSA